MADWVKIRHALVRSAKVRGLMRELHCKRHAALGLALDWLVWIDEQTEDGKTHLLPDELADEIGFRGCAEALIAVGWAALGSDGCVEAVEFGKHCGESAKKRAENALRKSKSRGGGEKCHAKSVTDVTLDVTKMCDQKRIEENSIDKRASNATAYMGAEGRTARAPICAEGFSDWLAAVCCAHEGLRSCAVLPRDVQAAAQEAFAAWPRAAQEAELLAAYMHDRMPVDRHGVRFWRPSKYTEYFRTLGEVIEHARRWQRESGWRKSAPKSHEDAAKTARSGSGGQLQRAGGKSALEEYQERMNERYGVEEGGEG